MYSFSFIIILLVGFVDMLGLGLVYPLFAGMIFDPQLSVASYDASPSMRGAMLGVLIAMPPLIQFISSPFLGALSDSKGRRLVLALGVGTGLLGYGLAIVGVYTESFWLLLVYRLCVGVSEGTIAVAQAALVDISTEENKTRRFSILGGALGLGFTVGPFLGGKLSDPTFAAWATYTTPFIVAGCLSFLNLLLILWKFPETRELKKEYSFNVMDCFSSFPKMFSWTHLRWVFIAGFALSFGWSFFQEFMPILLQDHFGFSSGGVGDYYACSGFWYAISSAVLSAPVVGRFSAKQILPLSLVGCAASMLLFLVSNEAYIVWVMTPILMYSISLVYPTGTTMVSDCVEKDSQGEALGVFQSVQAAAMALSPLIVGSAVGAFPALAAWGGAAAMLIAAAAYVRAGRNAQVASAA